MRKTYKDITGVILAGGQSSRMGFPKYFLTVKDKKIIDTTLEVFKSIFDEILIVTGDKNRFVLLQEVTAGFAGFFKGVEVVEDLVRGCGPLGGIYTGLKLSLNEKVFFVACDMPFLHIGLINRLLDAAKDGDFDCVISYTDKGIEPLHAIYSKKILPGLKNSLMKKELFIAEVLSHFNCKYIKAEAEELSSFFNVNTPDDLKEAESYESKIQSLA